MVDQIKREISIMKIMRHPNIVKLHERIRIDGIREHPWFQINYTSVSHGEDGDVSLDDVRAVFDDIEDQYVRERSEVKTGPLPMNAFEMFTLSQGLNLSALFDRRQDHVKRQTRFVSRKPAKDIISTIEVVAELLGFKAHTHGYKTRLEGASMNRAGQFAVVLEVFEVVPTLFMVDVRKAAGDTLEYHKASNSIILFVSIFENTLSMFTE